MRNARTFTLMFDRKHKLQGILDDQVLVDRILLLLVELNFLYEVSLLHLWITKPDETADRLEKF